MNCIKMCPLTLKTLLLNNRVFVIMHKKANRASQAVLRLEFWLVIVMAMMATVGRNRELTNKLEKTRNIVLNIET